MLQGTHEERQTKFAWFEVDISTQTRTIESWKVAVE